MTILATANCDVYEQEEYEEQYVVESYLIAGEPLPQVRITTTSPFDQEYLPVEVSVSDANVTITLQDEDETPQDIYEYSETRPGIYEMPQNNTLVTDQRTYKLKITFPDSDHIITSKTTVPEIFETLSQDSDSVVYQSDVQLQASFSKSFYPNRQSYYIFATQALEPDNYETTPFWKMADSETSSLTVINSGIINEENYTVDGDKLTLRYPWLGFAYFGPNKITTYAIDDNVYDFYRSQSVQLGGSTLSPGEIPNIIYNMDGAIGIFGSMSGASIQIFIKEPLDL